jgi:AbrB family looped-hinge helix DNA binding protein
MAAATVTSRGRVTLPAEIRRRLGVRAGTRLEFVVKGDDRIEVVRLGGSVRDLKRLLPRPARALPLDEMDKAIARGARGRSKRR